MADRPVRKTRKDADGDILALCNDGSNWSPRLKADAIQDIESGTHTYHVPWNDGRTEIRVVVAQCQDVSICILPGLCVRGLLCLEESGLRGAASCRVGRSIRGMSDESVKSYKTLLAIAN